MRILVADDELGSRLVAQAAVVALGHECVVVSDGEQAWAALQQDRPDVLVTDLSMPGMDGLELCRRVRTQDDGYVYVVLLTSHGQPQDMLAGMRAGADDYLRKPLDPLDLEARLLAAQRVTTLHAQLQRAQAEVARQARTDPLTGLRNRQTLTDELQDLHARSARYGHDYCVALADVDHFKRYNDTYGHLAGDEALRTVASTMREQLRDVDHVYRFGGEEFLVLLPEQTMQGACIALERVRSALQGAAVEHRTGAHGVLTLSVGICSVPSPRLTTPTAVLSAADAALYRAKGLGRNQVQGVLAPGAPDLPADADLPADLERQAGSDVVP